jgi:UDP-glucuronate 4-epimerase
MPNTFIITGGAGFIGSHLAKTLLDQGHHVAVIDNFNDYYDTRLKEYNISQLKNHAGFQLFKADITNKAELEAIFNQIGTSVANNGAIIHLAARAGVRPSILEPELYQQTNVAGTFYLAELAKRYGIQKFVFASSSSVYGERAGQANTDGFKETDDVSKPVSPYAATKIMGENMLHTYSYLDGLQVVALRFFTVYGPRQRPDLAIHKFAKLIDQGKPITVFGDGSARRDFTFIEDIIQGITGAIEFNQFTGTPFEVFNLGESHTTSVHDMIALIEAAMGKKAVLQFEDRHPADVTITFANVDKAKQLLNYNPSTKPDVGIGRFVDWFYQFKQQQLASV